jgi:hypothetical protein
LPAPRTPMLPPGPTIAWTVPAPAQGRTGDMAVGSSPSGGRWRRECPLKCPLECRLDGPLDGPLDGWRRLRGPV